MDFMSNAFRQLDTRVEILTPENIAFRYQVAGPFRRLPAYLIDLLIRAVVFSFLAAAISMAFAGARMPGLGVGLILILWFVLSWFYGGLFEAYWNGQTPGKRVMEIRVLSVDGQPINGLQAVLRNVLRALDAQPLIFYQLGLVAALMNDRFQRLGDLACGTMVVIEEPRWFAGVTRVEDPEAIRLAAQLPAGFQVSRTMARAIAAYVGRRAHIAPGLQPGIAAIVGTELRDRLGLPSDTDLDQLLCAIYHRTFIT